MKSINMILMLFLICLCQYLVHSFHMNHHDGTKLLSTTKLFALKRKFAPTEEVSTFIIQLFI